MEGKIIDEIQIGKRKNEIKAPTIDGGVKKIDGVKKTRRNPKIKGRIHESIRWRKETITLSLIRTLTKGKIRRSSLIKGKSIRKMEGISWRSWEKEKFTWWAEKVKIRKVKISKRKILKEKRATITKKKRGGWKVIKRERTTRRRNDKKKRRRI